MPRLRVLRSACAADASQHPARRQSLRRLQQSVGAAGLRPPLPVADASSEHLATELTAPRAARTEGCCRLKALQRRQSNIRMVRLFMAAVCVASPMVSGFRSASKLPLLRSGGGRPASSPLRSTRPWLVGPSEGMPCLHYIPTLNTHRSGGLGTQRSSCVRLSALGGVGAGDDAGLLKPALAALQQVLAAEGDALRCGFPAAPCACAVHVRRVRRADAQGPGGLWDLWVRRGGPPPPSY